MRRTLLGLVVAITLLIGFFLVYFSFSGFRSHGQSYLTSLSDFCFMVDSYRRQSFDSPAELDDASFAAVLDRFRQGSHWEVRERAVWALRHWGPAVAPRLLAAAEQAADPYLQVGIAKGLVAIRDPRAATVVSIYLERYLDDPRRFRSDFVDLLGATGDPRALPTLIALHRRHGERVGDLLEAIGKCGGTDYLLAELNQATTAEEVRKLLWPLTYTRDPRGLKAVARQLTHQDESVRIRAYSALGQSSGGEVVAPLLEVLAGVENEYILGSALNMVLARPVNRGQSGLAPYLAGLFDHPTLAWEARYALARVGGDEALQVLRERMAGEPPDSVMQHLDLLGGAALPFLEHYLDSPDSWVRHQALSKVEELLDPAVRPLLTHLLEDPDPGLRRRVSHILFDMDSLDLFRSFTLSLPEKFGRAAWRGFRADLSWGLRKSFRQALTTLTLLHWLGLAVSALLGLLLACNRVRIFEAYRFNLFVSFLLCEGLFGNYFFLGQELNRPQLVFTLATGVHLLLLIGYLFQERERLPGELRNRFERLGGASLWLLTPPLLYFGTPLVATGLRLLMHQFSQFLPYLAMLGVTMLLVLEQWAIPGNLFPRSARLQRLQGGLLAMLTVALFLWPLLRVSQQQLAASDRDGALFAALLIAPLIWMLCYHLVHLGLFRPATEPGIPPAPGSRLAASGDGDRFTVRLRRPRSLRRVAIQVILVLAAGLLTLAQVGRFRGDFSSLLLGLFAGLLGAAVAGFLIEAVAVRFVMQLRGGFVRCGLTRFGFTLVDGGWRRTPHLTATMRARLSQHGGRVGLEAEERDWLLDLRALSAGGINNAAETAVSGDTR